MAKDRDKYIPALSHDWLTPLYDPMIRLTMRELTFKRALIGQARIQDGHRVLDLGCGTATLTLLIKETYSGADVVGLDGDPTILEIAKAKALKAGSDIRFDYGMAYELPYADRSFDRVLSSLVFHHLTRSNKEPALREVFRILRPGAQLQVADWGKPQNVLMRVAALPLRAFDGLETTSDNVKGLLPELFREAGFEGVCERARYMTLFGTLSLYEARKPG